MQSICLSSSVRFVIPLIFPSVTAAFLRIRRRCRCRCRCRWVLGHHALELTPQRLDGAEFVAHGDDAFEGAVELVDVLEDAFEGLKRIGGY